MKAEKKIFITKQRQVILEELKKTVSHPTADEVFLMVRQRLPKISLGTVYRNLELLSENGVIQKLDWSGRQKRYDGNFENHYHIRCLNCGRVDDVLIKPFSVVEETFRAVSDYKIIGHRLEVLGLCANCKKP
ncbi:MAG: transcriptional repressor [Thermodesulfobacteriota bacterium]|nr:MAG: transcriptional repressor [Thermodesulfobacteriota bacterium]